MTFRFCYAALFVPFFTGCGPSATADEESLGSGGQASTEPPLGSGGQTSAGGAASIDGSGGALMSTGGGLGTGGASASGGASPNVGGTPGVAETGGASATGGASVGEIILDASFDDRVAGPYTEDLVAGDFGMGPTWNDGLDDGRAAIILDEANPVLRVTYPAGQYGPGPGGVQFKVPLGATYDELYLSYRLRFGSAFEFVKGGKLPGLVGGTGPTGCVQDDAGFSARMMWRAGGHAVQYLYFPGKVNDCGDDYDYQVSGEDALFVPNVWHTVEHRIRMNTPGEANGIMQAWFDGELALDNQSFIWRNAGHTWSIDTLYFSTFFGGSDETWAPSTDQTIDYDDFMISTAPIQR